MSGVASTSTLTDASELLRRHAKTLDAWLIAELPERVSLSEAPPEAAEPVRYALAGAGKRLRPALVLEACRAVGGTADDAIPAAVAVELIHTFSLVHDDLPAMDDDDLRRGRPTVHKAFDEAQAILAGDALSVMAFEVLTTSGLASDTIVKLVADLARATGVVGMIGGQATDIAAQGKAVTQDALRQLHARKTGALITASCVMGARSGGATDEQVEALGEFGSQVGLVFQIADDLLDITASTADVGKATNKDAGAGKNTYPALFGIDVSRQLAAEGVDAATEALASFDAGADGLRLLARFAASRRR